MASSKERATMLTSTAQTPDKVFRSRSNPRLPIVLTTQLAVYKNRALVLVEMLIVLGIVVFLTTLVTLNFTGAVGRTEFQKQAYEFINTLKMAQNAAAESDRRYAVVLDFIEKTYTLREFASLDLATIPDDVAVIKVGNFTEHCQLDYVVLDDLRDTRDEGEDIESVRFLAGHSGWLFGGKIVLRDADGYPYSVLVNRISRVITLNEGDVEIMEPLEDVPF